MHGHCLPFALLPLQAIESGLPAPTYAGSRHGGYSFQIFIVFAESVGPLCGQFHIANTFQIPFRLVLVSYHIHA